MGFFSRWGEAIGREAVEGMVRSGEMDRIVRNAMANEFEKLAKEPKYAHVSERFLKMAEYARSQGAKQ